MNPLISIIVVPFNSREWLPRLCDSLRAQTIWNQLEVIFVDSTSKDGSLEYAKELMPEARCFSGGINSFTNSNNIGVQKARGTFVFLVNPDMWLEPTCAEMLLSSIQKDERIACVVPKVQSYERNAYGKYLLDTTGLVLRPNGVVQDRGQGQVDNRQYEKKELVFGASGACAIFRKKALEDAAWNGEIFDNNYALYREDVDLSWRLQYAGWQVVYDPAAIAHHNRTVKEPVSKRQTLKARNERSPWVNAHAYRNQLLTILTHTTWHHLKRYGYKIIPSEIAKALYVLLNEPQTIGLLLKSGRIFIDTWRKRQHFGKLKAVDHKDLIKWVTPT